MVKGAGAWRHGVVSRHVARGMPGSTCPSPTDLLPKHQCVRLADSSDALLFGQQICWGLTATGARASRLLSAPMGPCPSNGFASLARTRGPVSAHALVAAQVVVGFYNTLYTVLVANPIPSSDAANPIPSSEAIHESYNLAPTPLPLPGLQRHEPLQQGHVEPGAEQHGEAVWAGRLKGGRGRPGASMHACMAPWVIGRLRLLPRCRIAW